MAKLKRIGLLFFAKLQALIMTIIGLITGILYAFGGFFYDVFTTGSVNWGTALAFFALIGMPAIFGVFGFVLGFVEALLYNLWAKWLGGIKIDVET